MEIENAATGETSDTLLELLDRVLNTGVVLAGEIAITVADVELIYLRLQLLLSSAQTAREAGWLPQGPHFGQQPSLPAGKGDGHLFCEAPEGQAPTEGWFRQKVTVPFSQPESGRL